MSERINESESDFNVNESVLIVSEGFNINGLCGIAIRTESPPIVSDCERDKVAFVKNVIMNIMLTKRCFIYML